MKKLTKKTKLEDLKRGDVVAVKYGFEYLKAIIIGNNGSHITWYSTTWSESSAVVSSYRTVKEYIDEELCSHEISLLDTIEEWCEENKDLILENAKGPMDDETRVLKIKAIFLNSALTLIQNFIREAKKEI